MNGAVVYVTDKPVDSHRVSGSTWTPAMPLSGSVLVEALRRRPTFQDEDLVFSSVRGGPRSESSLLESWRGFCQAAEVPFIYLYRLRSTAISLAKSTGLPTRIAAHSPAVQMRHYDETEESEQRSAALSLNEVLR